MDQQDQGKNQDIVRVMRLVQYEGPRDLVEEQVAHSIHGFRWGVISRVPRGMGPKPTIHNCVKITAVTLDEFPRRLEEAGETPDKAFGKAGDLEQANFVVGQNESGQVVVNHPDLKPDKNGVAHIVFSPNQARHLAELLLKHASEAEYETRRKRYKAIQLRSSKGQAK